MGCAQHCQDQWITQQFPPDAIGYAVEVGANDGKYFSNTMLLEEQGWTVLAIEADPRYVESLKASRKLWMSCAISDHCAESEDFNASGSPSASNQNLGVQAMAIKIPVPVITLNMALKIAGFPHLDVLSIDIEGGEQAALRGIDFTVWKPRVVIVEDWAHSTVIDEILKPFGYVFQEEREFDRLFLAPDHV